MLNPFPVPVSYHSSSSQHPSRSFFSSLSSLYLLDSGRTIITGCYFITLEPLQFILEHLCVIMLKNHTHQLCRRNLQSFQVPTISALYIHGIYLFFQNKDCTVWDAAGKTDPASLRGVNSIYSVYFLHAVHINPQRCQYTAHVLFHSALVFQRSIHHHRTALPERDIKFS